MITNILSNLHWIAIGAIIIMLLPPKYEDWLRQWLVSLPAKVRSLWQNLTKKG